MPNAVNLDDYLIWGNSFAECLEDVNRAVELLKYFGFKINVKKSVLILTQCSILVFEFFSGSIFTYSVQTR